MRRSWLGISLWSAVACGATAPAPSLAERMAEECTTIAGCERLLHALTLERNECHVGRRPVNCDEREASYLIVKQHLRERRELALERAGDQELDAGAGERESERDDLLREHAELSAKPVSEVLGPPPASADPEQAWRALDPKRCAFHGDEEACYELLRFLSTTGDGPRRAEARAALEAGKKIIAERTAKPQSPQSPPGGKSPQSPPGGKSPQSPPGGKSPQSPPGGKSTQDHVAGDAPLPE